MYVYAIGVEKEFVKFGMAANPRTRLDGIQVGCPVTIRLLSYMKVQNRTVAREIEAALHLAMNPHILRGEWFKWTNATEAAVECLRTHDTYRFRQKLQKWSSMLEYQVPKLKDARAAQLMPRFMDHCQDDVIDYIDAKDNTARRRFQ